MKNRIISLLTVILFIFSGSLAHAAEGPEDDGFRYEWELYQFPPCPLNYAFSREELIGGHFYSDIQEYCRILITDCEEDLLALIRAAQEYADSLELEKCTISISYIERYLLDFLSPAELRFSRCDPESEFYKLFISFSMKYGEAAFSGVELVKIDGEWLVMFRISETLAYRDRTTEEDGYFSPYILLSTYLVYGDANKASAALNMSSDVLYQQLEPGPLAEKEFWLITDLHYITGLTPPDDKNTVWQVYPGGDMYHEVYYAME